MGVHVEGVKREVLVGALKCKLFPPCKSFPIIVSFTFFLLLSCWSLAING